MSGLTAQVERLLLTLTWKLRVLSDAQAAVLLGVPGRRRRTAVRQLQRLQQRGLVARCRITLMEVCLQEPLVTWKPGTDQANWGRLAWDLEKRRAFGAPKTITVNWATRDAARLVGGVGGRLRQPLQVEHDWGTAAVFLRRDHRRSAGPRWIGEDAYRRHFLHGSRAKVPDAVLLNRRNQIVRAIEYGGLYTSGHLKSFHRYWSRRKVPYEIW